MPGKGMDTKVRRIARRIAAAVGSEGLLHADPDLEGLLHKVQSEAISLSVSTSELIGLMKRQDPGYAAAVNAMERGCAAPDAGRESGEEPSGGARSEGEEPNEAESAGESDEPESKYEKD